MPPINNQGSRAALVTTVVAFVIAFVTSTILAFHFYGVAKQETQYLADQKSLYDTVVAQNLASGPGVKAFTDMKGEQPPRFGIANVSQETAIDVAGKTVAGLVQVIVGNSPDTTASGAADMAEKAIAAAKETLAVNKVTDVKLTATGLTATVADLAKALGAKQKTLDAAVNTEKTTQATLDKVNASVAKTVADKDAAIKNAADAAAGREKDLNDQNATTTASVAAIATDQTTAGQKYAADVQRLEADVASAKVALVKSQREYDASNGRLQRFRPDTENSIIRQVDGHVISVPGNGVCYIDLGTGDHVVKGLTFEVYGKDEGIPPLPATTGGDEPLPVGKASVEIIEVGAASSECRIVKTTPGAVLTQGDLLVNLIYDAHVKPKFFIFGSFDLSQTGRPTAADGEVVKRLVTQWGGQLTEKVNVDTDYVVLGSEPTLPEFNKADMTPEETQKLQQASDALEKYTQLRNDAARLGIPILNQNRFLYYTGYYDQAKR